MTVMPKAPVRLGSNIDAATLLETQSRHIEKLERTIHNAIKTISHFRDCARKLKDELDNERKTRILLEQRLVHLQAKLAKKEDAR